MTSGEGDLANLSRLTAGGLEAKHRRALSPGRYISELTHGNNGLSKWDIGYFLLRLSGVVGILISQT